MKKKVLVEVSARHVHLSKEDVEKLFGKGHELKFWKKLSEHSDFAAEEVVDVVNERKTIGNVRVIGPVRDKRDVELAMTDAYFLKIKPMPKVCIHADENAPSVEIIGPKGKVEIPAIIKQRHLHASDKDAEKLGLQPGDVVKIRVGKERAVVFENVLVRVDPLYRLAVHLDTDEGNAAGISGSGEGEIISK